MSNPKVAAAFLAMAAAAGTYCFLVLFSDRPDLPRRNTRQAVKLLEQPELDTTTGADEPERFRLPNGVILQPGKEVSLAGYIFRIEVSGLRHGIHADPERFGQTGLYSYYRDDTGTIRYEIPPRTAGPNSRTWR